MTTRERRHNPVCPDCAATANHGALHHQPGCPIGEGYNKIQADDRAFFDTHPFTNVRRRKPVLAELLEPLLLTGTTMPPNRHGKAWTPGGYVLVHRTDDPNVRLKDYANAYLMENPEKPVTNWQRRGGKP
jgi:hypothetical protein